MGPSPLSILSSPHSLSLLLPGLCPPMPLSHNYTKSHSHIFSILHTLCIFTICHHPTSSPTLYPHSLSATLYPTPSYTYPYSPLSFYLAPYPVDHSIPLPRLHVTSSHMTHRV